MAKPSIPRAVDWKEPIRVTTPLRVVKLPPRRGMKIKKKETNGN